MGASSRRGRWVRSRASAAEDGHDRSPIAPEPSPSGAGRLCSVPSGEPSTSGARPSFEAFVADHGPRLHRVAWTLTRHEGDAQDLVQVALVKAWRAWPRIDDPQAYVRRILVREFTTSRRRAWHGEVPTGELPARAGADDSGWSDGPTLAVALARLPRAQRAVVVLRFLEDLSVDDTAAVLGVSAGTVKSHTSRALAALRVSPHLAGLASPKESS